MSATTAEPTPSKRPKNCNNKIGRNQYKDRPAPDDPRVSELLRDYHANGITDKSQVRKLLLEEHSIILSESSISRRKRKLGLKASHFTTLELTTPVKRRLILDQMAKDPKGRLGARTVKQGILRDTGIHLTRDYIREEMKKLDPAAHAARGPAHIKAKRQQRQLTVQNGSSSSSAPSEGSTQTVPLNLLSGSIPRYQHDPAPSSPHPIPSSPFAHSSPMDTDEESDSISIHPDTPRAEPPDQPNAHHEPPIHESNLPTPEPFQAVSSPSMTVALGILRTIAPQMGTLTRMLDSLNLDEEILDAQAHSLVTGGMEAAAFLERQLARVASKAQCSRP